MSFAVLIATGTTAFSQDQQSASETQSAVAVDGWQLMSEEERLSFRDEMRALETEEERQQFRQAHKEQMRARAAEQGVSLSGAPKRRAAREGRGAGRGQSGGGRRPAFVDFDMNGDGYIAQDEYVKAHAERVVKQAKEGREMKNAGRTTFADIDTDGDGRASPNEFAAHQAHQHRRQRN